MEITLSTRDGSTLEGADAVVERYYNSLICVPYSFSPDSEFGIGLPMFLSEQATTPLAKMIEQRVRSMTEKYFPELEIVSLEVSTSAPETITVSINVLVKPYGENRTVEV
jgi:hypothetical protein